MVVDAFSAIRSPVFSELVVVLACPRDLFTLGGHIVQGIVFLLEVFDFRDAERELTEALEFAAAKGFLSFLDRPPTIRVLDMSSPSNRYLSRIQTSWCCNVQYTLHVSTIYS